MPVHFNKKIYLRQKDLESAIAIANRSNDYARFLRETRCNYSQFVDVMQKLVSKGAPLETLPLYNFVMAHIASQCKASLDALKKFAAVYRRKHNKDLPASFLKPVQGEEAKKSADAVLPRTQPQLKKEAKSTVTKINTQLASGLRIPSPALPISQGVAELKLPSSAAFIISKVPVSSAGDDSIDVSIPSRRCLDVFSLLGYGAGYSFDSHDSRYDTMSNEEFSEEMDRQVRASQLTR